MKDSISQLIAHGWKYEVRRIETEEDLIREIRKPIPIGLKVSVIWDIDPLSEYFSAFIRQHMAMHQNGEDVLNF